MDTRNVNELRAHPDNAKIYGDHADSDLVESIRQKGVINPLLITYDNRIINGHRRWEAARKVGLQTVPVIPFPSEDELDILEALIESNRQRVKTNEQIGRENIVLQEVYHERESRQGDNGLKNPNFGSVSQDTDTRPRTKAADALGVSVGHAHRASAVVKAIDKLNKQGKQREAEQLRSTLNKKGVKNAYKKAQENGHINPSAKSKPKDTPREDIIVTLSQWNELGLGERELLLTSELGKSTFNKQDTDNIEWAKWSWNPVTGCKHNCPYCYARDIAERFYPHKFEPTFIPGRLIAPENTRVPQEAQTDIGYKNVFTCSMADLFGRWVPAEWIEAVLSAVRGNPQWNFLFLTKFPIRMAEFDFPDNAWVGTTVDCQIRVRNAEEAFKRINAKVKWLSCEPLLEPLEFASLEMFSWIVLGGSSPSTQTPEWRPPRAWINELEHKAHEAGCMVYEKTNLLYRIKEYPGQAQGQNEVLPEALRYLPSVGS